MLITPRTQFGSRTAVQLVPGFSNALAGHRLLGVDATQTIDRLDKIPNPSTEAPFLPPLRTAQDLAGAFTGTATFTGTLEGRTSLEGSWSGTATFTGDLQTAADLVGSFAGGATVTGALVGTADLEGSWSGLADFTGALDTSQVVQLTGSFGGATAFSGTLIGDPLLITSVLVEPMVAGPTGTQIRAALVEPMVAGPTGTQIRAALVEVMVAPDGDSTRLHSVLIEVMVSPDRQIRGGTFEGSSEFVGALVGDARLTAAWAGLASFSATLEGDATLRGTFRGRSRFVVHTPRPRATRVLITRQFEVRSELGGEFVLEPSLETTAEPGETTYFFVVSDDADPS